jgi:hypothetical protein
MILEGSPTTSCANFFASFSLMDLQTCLQEIIQMLQTSLPLQKGVYIGLTNFFASFSLIDLQTFLQEIIRSYLGQFQNQTFFSRFLHLTDINSPKNYNFLTFCDGFHPSLPVFCPYRAMK